MIPCYYHYCCTTVVYALLLLLLLCCHPYQYLPLIPLPSRLLCSYGWIISATVSPQLPLLLLSYPPASTKAAAALPPSYVPPTYSPNHAVYEPPPKVMCAQGASTMCALHAPAAYFYQHHCNLAVATTATVVATTPTSSTAAGYCYAAACTIPTVVSAAPSKL